MSRSLWLGVAGIAVWVVATDAARPVKDSDGVVGVTPDLDGRLDEVSAQRAWFDLEAQPAEDDGIVVAGNAVLLMAQDYGDRRRPMARRRSPARLP